MGYYTNFDGEFTVTPPLSENHKQYLFRFSQTRRMKRYPEIVETFQDPVRAAVGLSLGPDGGYFVGDDETAGVLNGNQPPAGQPGLWCDWEPNDDGTTIRWNESEKFDKYVEWLQYLVTHFLQPWGYKINGEVRWRGEDFNDCGTIYATNNKIVTEHGYGH